MDPTTQQTRYRLASAAWNAGSLRFSRPSYPRPPSQADRRQHGLPSSLRRSGLHRGAQRNWANSLPIVRSLTKWAGRHRSAER